MADPTFRLTLTDVAKGYFVKMDVKTLEGAEPEATLLAISTR